MLDTILFDNDGVLVDTESLFYESNLWMMRRFGYEVSEEEFAELGLIQGKSLADIIIGLGYSREVAEEARQKRNIHYDEILRKRAGTLVIDGVKETLDDLHMDFRIGVVTCCQRMHFNTIHATGGLMEYFDFIVDDEDFTQHKPHPEPYLVALERAGLNANQVIAVEDSERGVLSAKAAGLAVYAIPRGISRYGKFDVADKVFTDITAFRKALRNGTLL